MNIKDFENKIKTEIHLDLEVRPHPVNLDMAGVYFRNAFLCGMPSNNIFEARNIGYCDKFGTPHSSITEVEGKIRHFLKLMLTDKDIYDLMAKPYQDL